MCYVFPFLLQFRIVFSSAVCCLNLCFEVVDIGLFTVGYFVVLESNNSTKAFQRISVSGSVYK